MFSACSKIVITTVWNSPFFPSNRSQLFMFTFSVCNYKVVISSPQEKYPFDESLSYPQLAFGTHFGPNLGPSLFFHLGKKQ